MRISAQERRARLGVRQMLAAPNRAETVEEVAERLVGLHATDATSVVLSARARLAEPTLAELDRALYEDRTVVRMHAMRRTLFAVPTTLVSMFHAATAAKVAARERAMLLRQLASSDSGTSAGVRGAEWLAAAEREAWEALADFGEEGASSAQLSDHVPRLRETITLSPGKRYEATLRVGGSVLRLLAMEGRVRRARQIGGWASSQFRFVPVSEPEHLEVDAAQAELVRRWLTTYGPGTSDDLRWWTGLTRTEVHRALGRLDVAEVRLDDGTGWSAADDTGADAAHPEPWAAFLPTLDPATMGWKQRDFCLDPAHRDLLFDSAGNGGPTVWWNGEMVGAWAQRGDGRIVWRLLADRGAQARTAVAEEAERLEVWLAERGLVSSFPAPLTRELTA
ncbi:winged helix DNA-binding domain-containing protein [Streptomyces sp. XM4193]|uniref:winged helix DNA-binding domain-containing protein n=1 Tax=Streptomyces sp. XM4193 TaxID=2929782 RepID=UPI001FFB68A2|nr:winged helix DNA-binding domain-containing protein [Streptomyces sp. XM4193]MCK1798634.1 winged helix DNA-binding domain-containing protein [Streptomyces sp. XM4193]